MLATVSAQGKNWRCKQYIDAVAFSYRSVSAFIYIWITFAIIEPIGVNSTVWCYGPMIGFVTAIETVWPDDLNHFDICITMCLAPS